MVNIALILEQLGFLSIDIDFCFATVWEISQLFVYNLIDDGRCWKIATFEVQVWERSLSVTLGDVDEFDYPLEGDVELE